MMNESPAPQSLDELLRRTEIERRPIRDARTALSALINSPDDELSSRMRAAMRDLLIDPDADDFQNLSTEQFAPFDPTPAEFALMRSYLAIIRADKYSIDFISHLALDESLCPLHFIDYAICFDDDDPECAQIRATFPGHDT